MIFPVIVRVPLPSRCGFQVTHDPFRDPWSHYLHHRDTLVPNRLSPLPQGRLGTIRDGSVRMMEGVSRWDDYW